MYSLGDMYDIPGLRNYACKRLQELFNLNPYLDWTDAMSVWEIGYQSSRKGDSLRQILTKGISVHLFKERRNTLRTTPGLHEFLDRCPELASDLLWISIQRDESKYVKS